MIYCGPMALSPDFAEHIQQTTHEITHDMYVGEKSSAVIKARELAAQPIGTQPLVILDIETTGPLYLRGDRIVKIAMKKVSPSGANQEFTRLVNPERPIPDDMLGITDIPIDEIETALPFKDMRDEIRAHMEDSIIVAHDAPSVLDFLLYEYELHDELPPVLPLICTLRLARGSIMTGRYTLPHLARMFDMKVDKSLDCAQSNIEMTDQVFRRIVKKIQDNDPNVQSYSDIIRRMNPSRADFLTVPISSEQKMNCVQTLHVFQYTGEILSFDYITARSDVSKPRRVKVLGIIGRHFRAIDVDDPELSERTFNIDRIVRIT